MRVTVEGVVHYWSPCEPFNLPPVCRDSTTTSLVSQYRFIWLCNFIHYYTMVMLWTLYCNHSLITIWHHILQWPTKWWPFAQQTWKIIYCSKLTTCFQNGSGSDICHWSMVYSMEMVTLLIGLQFESVENKNTRTENFNNRPQILYPVECRLGHFLTLIVNAGRFFSWLQMLMHH